MRAQLVHYLKSFAGLSALVGSNIFPQRAPTADAAPYVTIKVVDRDPSYDQDGADGYNQQFFEINSNGETLLDAVDVSYQIEQAMKIQNTIIGDVGETELLRSTTLLSESDNFDLFDGSQEGIRTVTTTYRISYTEA